LLQRIASARLWFSREFVTFVTDPFRPVYTEGLEPTSSTPYWKRLETWFLAAAFLILVATAISAWLNWQSFASARNQARLNRNLADDTEKVLTSLRDAESAQRGFLVTGKDAYLEPYTQAISTIPDQLQELRASTPDQGTRLDELDREMSAKLAELKESIDARRTGGFESARQIVATDRGRESMDRIRVLIRTIRNAEYARYQAYAQTVESRANQSLYIYMGGDIVLCILLVLAGISMTAGAERRDELIGALQEDERRLRDLREKAETAEEQVRNILESIADGFLSFDRNWIATYCNNEAARIFDRPKSDIVGRDFWKEFPEFTGDEFETKLRAAATDRNAVNFQTFLKCRNSYWELSAYPSRDGLTLYFRDITVRKRFEERSRHSHKLESLGILAGGIAHDFNNLLTAILGGASLVQEELAKDSRLRPLIDNVIVAGERAGQLTRQMLAYSGRGRFVVEPIDVSHQIREITALLESSVTPQVELILDLQSEGVLIEGDAGQIQQLIMNLVINGAEAIGQKPGRVVVSTRVEQLESMAERDHLAGGDLPAGAYIRVEVHDTGVGMDEATLSRIFDPFFTTKFTGRGLGLAAVLGIVRGHHGAIKVYSNPGQGTTFKVFFPIAKGQIIPLKEASNLDFTGTATVLVVDDEDVIQNLAKSTLERYGYRVVVASNGEEALKVFGSMKEEIALVLLDMTMPIMSGEETLTHLKALHPTVRVIASSGYNEIEALRRFGDGISAFLQKPYRSSQLAEKVKLTLT
jgi:PAS domain S-box-containing protein